MDADLHFVARTIADARLLLVFFYKDGMRMVDVNARTQALVPYAHISKALSTQPGVVQLNDKSFELTMLPTYYFLYELRERGVHVSQTRESLQESCGSITCRSDKGALLFDVLDRNMAMFTYELEGTRGAICWNQLQVKQTANKVVLFTALQDGVKYREITMMQPLTIEAQNLMQAYCLADYFYALAHFAQHVILASELEQKRREAEYNVFAAIKPIYTRPQEKCSIKRRFGQLINLLTHEELEAVHLMDHFTVRSTSLKTKRRNSDAKGALRLSYTVGSLDPFCYHYNEFNERDYCEEVFEENVESCLEYRTPHSDIIQYRPQFAASISYTSRKPYNTLDLADIAYQSVYPHWRAPSQSDARQSTATVTRTIEAIDKLSDIKIVEKYFEIDIPGLHASVLQFAEKYRDARFAAELSVQMDIFAAAYAAGYHNTKCAAALAEQVHRFCAADKIASQPGEFAKIDGKPAPLLSVRNALLVHLANLLTQYQSTKGRVYTNLRNALLAWFALQDAGTPELIALFEARLHEAVAAAHFETRAYSEFASTLYAAADAFERLDLDSIVDLQNREELRNRSQLLRIKLYKASADIFAQYNKMAQALADALYCYTLGGQINLQKYSSRYFQIAVRSKFESTALNVHYLITQYSIEERYQKSITPIAFAQPVVQQYVSQLNGYQEKQYRGTAFVYFDETFCYVYYRAEVTAHSVRLLLFQECSAFSVTLNIQHNVSHVVDRKLKKQASKLSGCCSLFKVTDGPHTWILAVDVALHELLVK